MTTTGTYYHWDFNGLPIAPHHFSSNRFCARFGLATCITFSNEMTTTGTYYHWDFNGLPIAPHHFSSNRFCARFGLATCIIFFQKMEN